MLHSLVFTNYSITAVSSISVSGRINRRFSLFTTRAFLNKSSPSNAVDKPPVVLDSLRLLEWDKLCDSVSSFAGTSLGKESTKEKLWSLNQTYDESLKLLDETKAAVEMHKYGCGMDFSGIDVVLVKSAIRHAQRGLPVDGNGAMAIVSLLYFAENLQLNLKAAVKEDAEWYQRFMPLAEMITELEISRSLAKFIQQLIDEDGSVKDSASSTLKRARDQVRSLENKLYQLMDRLIRNDVKDASTLQVSNSDGRICLKLGGDVPTSFEGLLLSSGSVGGSIIEPVSAVPLNDDLQRAKALVKKAEADVLLKITEKMVVDLFDIENLFNSLIKLDVVNARATYSLSFGGTLPYLLLPGTSAGSFSKGKWTLYLPGAYHPLLLQRHRQNLKKAKEDVRNATSEIRRRKQQGEFVGRKEETVDYLSSLEVEVTKLEEAHPIPVDISIAQKTRVVVITGPNTGGKTICLKTIGLAAMMAKSGLYVISSEPVQIPWFDSVYADIGDEQSLSQSLSTFSGHLRQISEILKNSTSRSLVLLDEVGAGTNPLEGAALGMSLLESFANSGPLLTIATTHHGELKTLKYSNGAFENACMEFDDVNIKPTYRILWGVPGRSNAINIAERLGLPGPILDNARELYGAASAEINEIILDMERLKQSAQEHVDEAQAYLKRARVLHEVLLAAERKVVEHSSDQRYLKIGKINEMGAIARSLIHKKVRQIRASSTRPSQPTLENSNLKSTKSSRQTANDSGEPPVATKVEISSDTARKSALEKSIKLPKVGDLVHINSLNKGATVLKVEPSKEEVLVQVGMMKLKLKLADLAT